VRIEAGILQEAHQLDGLIGGDSAADPYRNLHALGAHMHTPTGDVLTSEGDDALRTLFRRRTDTDKDKGEIQGSLRCAAR
jgi:hypothetical protein